MIRRKSKSKTTISLTQLLPNIITLLALIIGCSALKAALDGKWELSVFCIVIAAVLDGIDGKIARILNATSVFGAQLDSLCDCINFGVTPAVVIYLWLPKLQFKSIIWAAMLSYVICTCIRLARFNTNLINPIQENKYFFTGVAAPGGALLALIPIMLSFDHNIFLKKYPIIIAFYVIFIGFLMISRLPTISMKHLKIPKQYIRFYLFFIGIMIISTFLYPWQILPIIGIIYLLSIPVTFAINKKINNQKNTSLNHD